MWLSRNNVELAVIDKLSAEVRQLEFEKEELQLTRRFLNSRKDILVALVELAGLTENFKASAPP